MLRGPSGSGKSTLLSLIAGIATPPPASVFVLEQDLARCSARQRDRLRADHIGYIFQQFNLLPYLSARANVELGVKFSPARRARLHANGETVTAAAIRLLSGLGIADVEQSAAALSVGQQQRVAAARALIGAPELLIADEPTSALDSDRRDEFIALLMQECAAQQTALLFVTHDQQLAKHFDRDLSLAALTATEVADV